MFSRFWLAISLEGKGFYRSWCIAFFIVLIGLSEEILMKKLLVGSLIKKYTLVVAMLAVFFLVNQGGFHESALILAFGGLIGITYLCEKDNLFHLNWLIAVYMFGVGPVVLFLYNGVDFDIEILGVMLFLTALAQFMTRGLNYRALVVEGRFYLYATVLCMALVMGGAGIFGASVFYYCTPMICLFVAFAFRSVSLRGGLLLILIYALYILFFMEFYWSGFGRLVIAGWLAVPVIVFMLQYKVPYNKYALFLIVPVVGFLMSILRFKDATVSQILSAQVKDSNLSPYLLAQDLYADLSDSRLSVEGAFDQFVLFFLAAIPREVWPSKPVGFGFQYTVQQLDAHLIDAGHSVAALFFGEFFYYMGEWWILGALLSVSFMVLIFRFSFRLDPASGVYVVPVVVWVLTYVWGGLASFANRFHMGVIVIILVYALFYFIRAVFRPTSRAGF